MKKIQSNQVTNNQVTKKTFIITGMDCAACAIDIDGELEESGGVKSSKTNYAKSQTEVEFDPKKISEMKIIEIIKKSGYTVKVHG